MRTTLTLDKDVAAQLGQLRRARNGNLEDLVNEALRRGLREMTAVSKAPRPFRTRTFKMGASSVDLDNVAEALALLEGEGFK